MERLNFYKSTFVAQQRLGDTVLLHQDGEPAAFAVCHCDAGGKSCLIKFGAVRPNAKSRQLFAQLLRACEAMTHDRGSERTTSDMNFGRHEEYRTMFGAGFRASFQGVRMHRPNEVGFCRVRSISSMQPRFRRRGPVQISDDANGAASR